TDTGCGNISIAGAVIEVMGVRGAMTNRVTTSHSVSGW
ncbi:phage tail protein, partial [Salmonella enterica subsp. enterica serovar Infantis]